MEVDCITQFKPEDENDEEFDDFNPGDFGLSPPLAIGDRITLSREKTVYNGGPNRQTNIRTFEVVDKHTEAEFNQSYKGSIGPGEFIGSSRRWFTIYTLRRILDDNGRHDFKVD